MISKNIERVNPEGSSLTFSAQGGRGKEKILIAAKKISAPKRGRLGRRGSGGGMPNRPSVVAPPPALLRAEPSKILFFLIEKIFRGRAKEKIVKSILLGGEQSERRRGGSVRFRSEFPRARRVVSRGSVQRKLEFRPNSTA